MVAWIHGNVLISYVLASIAVLKSKYARYCQSNVSCSIEPDQIPCAFNCFMNVPLDGKTSTFTVEPPISQSGYHIDLFAEMDVVIGITACSAGLSNGGSFKPTQ